MSDSSVLLGELRADFAERNTALFLLLGILSAGDRLVRSVAHAQSAPSQTPSTADYFALGLFTLVGRVQALAARCAEDVPEQGKDAEAGRLPIEGLLR